MSDLTALFEGTDLSEEFKTQAEVIFTTAVDEKVATAKTELETKLQEEFDTKVEARLQELETANESYIKDELVPHVDRYLTAAADEWIKENAVTVESSLKVDLAESFLTGLSGLAAQHNLQLPEGQDKLVELQGKIDELSEKAKELLDANIDLQTENTNFKKSGILATVTANLSEAQKEKFAAPASKVEFKSEEQYTTALKSLAESYFPVQANTETPKITEGKETKDPVKQLTPEELYIKTLSEKARATR